MIKYGIDKMKDSTMKKIRNFYLMEQGMIQS
jgi:hypothetical protein